jgi:hypothetical protein
MNIIVKLLILEGVNMTIGNGVILSKYRKQFNLPNNEFSDTSTNNNIRSYLIKVFNWNNRKDFINFLDKTGFLYGSNEKRKESNKRNRDALSLDVHNCINNNHRLITCYLG